MQGQAPGAVLLLVAMDSEAEGLIKELHLKPIWTSPKSPYSPQKVYVSEDEDEGSLIPLPPQHMDSGCSANRALRLHVMLALTGALEHNAVPLAAQMLLGRGTVGEKASGYTFRCAVNFGSVGAYHGRGLTLGDAFFTREARHYDHQFPGVDSATRWLLRPICMPIPELPPGAGIHCDQGRGPNGIGVVCASGGRFNSGEDAARLAQEGCDCEDMEVYGLASLCDQLEMPLVGLKYAANYCDENGPADFMANVCVARAKAQELLFSLLRALAAEEPHRRPGGAGEVLGLGLADAAARAALLAQKFVPCPKI